MYRLVRRGLAGMVWQGKVMRGRERQARLVVDRSGAVRQAWRVTVRHGRARQGRQGKLAAL